MLLTFFLLGLVYVVLIGVAIASKAAIAVLFIAVLFAAQVFFSDKIALRAMGVREVSPQEAPELHAMIERLCIQADLPKPRVGVMHSAMPNAFAMGRSQKSATVCATTGIMELLSPAELEGVLAHELTHVINRDVLIMTLASFFAMLAALLTRFGIYGQMFGGGRRDNGPPVWLIVFVVSILTYILSYLLIRMISRYREYAADRGSALITGAPENLMSALQKIASGIMQIPQQDLREVQSMNAFFIIPTSVKSTFGELFATHPPLEKRLARLAEIAREMGKPVA